MAGPYDYAWKKLRLRVLAEEGGVCQVCGGKATQVDHIQPVSRRPDLRLVRSNLRAICQPCNGRKSNTERGTVRRQW